jgi:hypothetical protein
MKLEHIALAAAAIAGYFLLVKKNKGALAGATGMMAAGGRGLDWQAPPPKLTGWSLLDPTIKGSPGQMAVGLFSSSNERDS